jgi:glycerol-3-phosphate dehydrogenase (NAD(P)+)
MKTRIGVLGGGSWGATLANHLGYLGHDVSVWEFVPTLAEHLEKTRTLTILPSLRLHDSVRVTSDLAQALSEREVVVSAVPSEHVRGTFRAINQKACFPTGAWAVSVTKGVENDTLFRMSEVIVQELPALTKKVAILSGPSHAEEVVQGIPTAVVSAGPEGFPEKVHDIFNGEALRVYTSPDAIGVELGGAFKNIYAVACGVCDGLGLGDNTKAALMTRGLNEMTRLGMAAGAQGVTFFGLSGLGDLIVTCLSRHSRNRLLGEKIGQGKTLKEALADMTMVAEGVRTAKSGYQQSQRSGLSLPIITEIYKCLYEDKPAREAVRDLTARPVTDEMSHIENLFKQAYG